MFGVFVAGTMFITKWAASKTKSAADFYTAGGGITASRTAWQSPATTCPLRLSWVFPLR
jgi:Na+(H+)/acetate symporter ActP